MHFCLVRNYGLRVCRLVFMSPEARLVFCQTRKMELLTLGRGNIFHTTSPSITHCNEKNNPSMGDVIFEWSLTWKWLLRICPKVVPPPSSFRTNFFWRTVHTIALRLPSWWSLADWNRTTVVYFNQQMHACACVYMVEKKHSKIIKVILFSSCVQEAHVRLT